MKKLLISLAIGTAAVCIINKMRKDGQLDGICDCTDKFLSRSKRNLKNVADIAKNEAEYIKDRLDYVIGKK